MRSVKSGIRWFHCEDCDHLWDEPCRDAQTPSGVTCPNFQSGTCENYVLIGPYGYQVDEND